MTTTVIRVSQQQALNALALQQLLRNTPEHRVSLSYYEHTPSYACGTLHCSLGWAAVTDYFRQQGLCLTKDPGYGSLIPFIKTKDRRIYNSRDIADHLFGTAPIADGTWHILFAPYGGGTWDNTLTVGATRQNHKQLALKRLEKWIGMLEIDFDLNHEQETA